MCNPVDTDEMNLVIFNSSIDTHRDVINTYDYYNILIEEFNKEMKTRKKLCLYLLIKYQSTILERIEKQKITQQKKSIITVKRYD